MSFSFIVIDLDNKIDIKDFQNQIYNNYSDYEIIYCSSKQISNFQNTTTYVFDKNENPEKIINSVVMYANKSNMVVIRDYTNMEDIKKQTKSLLLNNQVVYFKKELSPFKKFIWKIVHFFAKILFAKDIVPINYSCATYGEIATNVLKKIEFPSNLMRTNQWQGVQLVTIDGGKPYKFKYNVKKNIFQTLIPLTLMILGIILFFVFRTKFDVLLKIIVWLFNIICFIIFMVYGLNWFIKNEIGENISQKSNL